MKKSDHNLPVQKPGPSEPAETDVSRLIQNRIEKLSRLRESGVNPYPVASDITQDRLSTSTIKERFESIKTGEESGEDVRLCGRVMTRRDMGKAAFAHIQDSRGQMQIYVRKDAVGDKAFDLFSKSIDLGDIIGTRGKMFRTKTGELSLKSEEIVLLSKALRPMPEKWHGLKDPEIRARQRELDLIANPESVNTFIIRSKIIQSLRNLLSKRGFIEVETPMMQTIPGGAVAKPFETYHNALKAKFYLRVAPELYLKRCLVGGLDRVFEIGRVFRNEGIDTLHNPEFTILEAYESYGNMETMIDLTEYLISETARAIGLETFSKRPYRRRTIEELFRESVGEEEAGLVRDQDWEGLARKAGQTSDSGMVHKVFDHLFSQKIAPALTEPTFVTEFPADFSPLAKRKEGSPNVTERFELYVDGEELANAYSELNDPAEQKERLLEYRRSRTGATEKEEAEGMGIDESFITALEYGMPPAGGLGIGVDRLIMCFTGQKSIRNVLLFPTLKPEK